MIEVRGIERAGEPNTIEGVLFRNNFGNSRSSLFSFPSFPYLRSPNSRNGFTLFELLVVLVLLSILTAIAFPAFGRGVALGKLQTSAREVAAAIRVARARALQEQQPFILGFDLEKNQIHLSSQDLKYQKTYVLPEGISLKKVSSPGVPEKQDRTELFFFFVPNGMSQHFEVVVSNDRGRQVKVVQNALTGSPRIEEISNDGIAR
jgi:general secretion pathway protein H